MCVPKVNGHQHILLIVRMGSEGIGYHAVGMTGGKGYYSATMSVGFDSEPSSFDLSTRLGMLTAHSQCPGL